MSLAGDAGRSLLLFLVRLVYPAAPKPPPEVDLRAVKSVLVIRTDTRVGNVLLTTPLVRALRRGLPEARIDFLVAEGKQALVEGLADRVVRFRKTDFFRNPARFRAFVKGLREARYDVVIEAGHWHAFSFTAAWLARATRAKIRIGHARGPSERFLTHEVQKVAVNVREVTSKLELLGPLGLLAAGEQLETTVDGSPALAAEADALVRALAKGKPMVAMNPGARKPDHRWAAEGFGALAQRLAADGFVPLLLWGPGEEAICEAVQEASAGAAILAPPTDLAMLAALFRRSALVVTNDTGPMHLAVATGTRVLAVLLAADGARWSHAGRFAGVPVRDAGPDAVDRVYAAARTLLEEPR